MFKNHATYEDSCYEAGKNSDEYTKKMVWLQSRWSKKDSTASEFIRPIISSKLAITPLSYSVISDNLKYFQSNYKEYFESDNKEQDKMDTFHKILARACLCGSQKIADFLLKEMGLNYLSPECEYILNYVSASENREWITIIATEMAQHEKEMPKKEIATLAQDDVYDMIERIFKEAKEQRNNGITNRSPTTTKK